MVIRVEAPSGGYDVTIGKDLKIAPLMKLDGAQKIAVITDDNVRALYYDRVEAELGQAGYKVCCCTVPHGEQSKCGATFLNILEFLAERSFTRRDGILALGGGVVGDLAGFVAASYMRGVRYASVPTTLLSMTDSSVGGKTAIDLRAGKNLAGAFWQPTAVIIDTETLKTLPDAELKNGLGELIKYAVIEGGEIVELLEKGFAENAGKIIAAAVDIKRKIVEADEREGGLRRILNFGHTPAHAAEKLSGYAMPHGMAVAAGVNLMMRASVASAGCPVRDMKRIKALSEKYSLPTSFDYSREALAAEASHDKKADGGDVNLVVARKVGKTECIKLPIEKLADFYAGKGEKL